MYRVVTFYHVLRVLSVCPIVLIVVPLLLTN